MSHSIVYESWTFPADKIKEGNLYLATSLLASSLEVNSFAPVVECDDPSILDFQRNAKLLYYAEPGRPMVFRVQNIKRAGPSRYEISATSTLGLLTEGRHMGGIYTGQEAEEVILDICGTVPVEIKNVLKKIKLYGWLPIAAPRDNFAQVLFAIGATLKTDLDGVLRVEGLWDGISGQVPKNNMYTDASVDRSARITQVIVTEHQYVPWTEEKQLFEGTAQAGDVITFDEPMHSLSAQGFTIQASGANWAQVSAGSGVLTGKTYLHNTRQISKAVQAASTPNVKTVEDITLVSLVNSQACAQRLVDYHMCRERIDAPVVYQGENPGDRLATWHPFDKIGVAACLESADITLSNTLKAQEKLLVGYVPPKSDVVKIYDGMTVVTKSGKIDLPAGVTKVRVVLISGGQGGQAGFNGEDGEAGGSAYSSTSSIAVGTKSKGGLGGEKGAPGSGGRVIELDLTIDDLSSITCEIGAGGLAGQGNGAEGSYGGDTTISIDGVTYSSVDGSSSPIGYTDTVTGDVYAVSGQPGVAGANGGDGSTDYSAYNPDAEAGGSVGGYPGGAPGERTLSSSSQSKNVRRSSPRVEDTTGTPTYQYKNYTYWLSGYTTMSVSSDGQISCSNTKTIGYVTGTYPGPPNVQFTNGTVYDQVTNPSAPSSPTNISGKTGTAVVNSSCRSRELIYTRGLECTMYTTNINKRRTYTFDLYSITQYWGHCPNAGGGAAKGRSGGNATTSAAGAGASPNAPSTRAILGSGGDGGHGGGGGGGGGAGFAQVDGDYSQFSVISRGYGSSGGSKGIGSPGANGANGCILLYYGVPKLVESGQLVDKQNRMILDRLGRRIIM